LTRFFGRYVDTACENAAHGRETRALGWRDIVETIRPAKVSPAT
jgi:hypothetical protein